MKRLFGISACLVLITGFAAWGTGGTEATEERPLIRAVWTDAIDPPSGRMLEYVEDKIGIEFESIAAGVTDYLQTTNVMLASGDIPDILQLRENTEHILQDWLNSDYILELDDYLSSYPILNKWLQETKPFIFRDGHYIGIPKNYAHHPHAMYYRKDLLDKYNLEVPRTFEDFHHAVKTIADGEGIYGLTSNGLQYAEWFLGGYTGGAVWTQIRMWVQRDGEWVDVVVTPEMREALKALNQWYDEGLYDPEFAVRVPYTAYHERFITGQVPAFSAHVEAGGFYEKLKRRTEESVPGAEVIGEPHPVGPWGQHFVYTRDRHTAFMYITKASEHPEKALDLFEWLFSPEGEEFNTYGIEGIHYIKSGDTYTRNWDEIRKEVANDADPLVRWRWYSNIQAGVYPEEALDQDRQQYLFDYNQRFPTPPQVTGYSSENDLKSSPVLQQLMHEWLIAFITGEKDVDTQWDEWVAEYDRAGHAVLKQEVNEYCRNTPELCNPQ